MAETTLTTLSNVLKDLYLDPIREQLNSKTVLLSRLEKNKQAYVGEQAVIPLHVGRNGGIGARAEGGTLPTAGRQAYARALYQQTELFGRISISNKSLAIAKANEGSFIDALHGEIKGMTDDLLRDFNRQLYTNKSGVLATLASDPGTGTTFTVDSTAYLYPGMRISIIDDASTPGNVTTRQDNVVASITSDTVFETTTAAVAGILSGDWITIEDSYSNEIYGLGDLVGDGDAPDLGTGGGLDHIGGIDDYTYWASKVESNYGTFSQSIFQEMIDHNLRNSSGEGITLFVTDYPLFRAYADSMLIDRRFHTSGSGFDKLDGGYSYLKYDDIPVVADRDCQEQTIYGLEESTLMLLEAADWQFMEDDGAMLHRLPNEAGYEATMFKICEFATDNRKANSRYEGITV